ncbi:MAG: GatB/YqeY domain-containing protein [Candidatus Nealsonbacteria bacterium]|nr:GatB/YqeY domain-containing protein [Candidatus Nealsonbacteria bacterium]
MLRQRISGDISSATKNKEEITLSVLRMLRAAILSKEKEKRYKLSKSTAESELEEKSALTDEEILETVSSEAKKRKESISAFEKGNRLELAEKEKKELEILMKYLPEQISEEELKKMVKDAIDKVGAKEIKDMGKVMAELMPNIKGRADGGTISRIAKELMGK